MSIESESAAWESTVDDVYQIVVLARLGDQANAQGLCYPSIAYLAKKCRMSERKAREVIGQLSQAGHLTIYERPGRSSVYRIHPIVETPAQRAGVLDTAAADARQAAFAAALDAQPSKSSMSIPGSSSEVVGAQTEHVADEVDGQTPAQRAGVGCGQPCGSNIHTPAQRAPTPARHGSTPLHSVQTPLHSVHPESSLNLIFNHLSISEASDDKNNPQTGKPEPESGRRRMQLEPTAAELEIHRHEELKKIDDELKRRGAA